MHGRKSKGGTQPGPIAEWRNLGGSGPRPPVEGVLGLQAGRKNGRRGAGSAHDRMLPSPEYCRFSEISEKFLKFFRNFRGLSGRPRVPESGVRVLRCCGNARKFHKNSKIINDLQAAGENAPAPHFGGGGAPARGCAKVRAPGARRARITALRHCGIAGCGRTHRLQCTQCCSAGPCIGCNARSTAGRRGRAGAGN